MEVWRWVDEVVELVLEPVAGVDDTTCGLTRATGLVTGPVVLVVVVVVVVLVLVLLLPVLVPLVTGVLRGRPRPLC